MTTQRVGSSDRAHDPTRPAVGGYVRTQSAAPAAPDGSRGGVPGETITLNEAAERLGVHYMTAYRYVRTGRLPAVKVGSEWRVRVEDVEAMRSGASGSAGVGGPPSPGHGGGRRRRHDYAQRLQDRLLAGDEPGAWSILESALTSGLEPAELYLEALGPALTRIGDDWEAGRITVAEEHRASTLALRLIGRLGPRFSRRGRKRGTVVLGAAPEDHHGVPVALAADLLRGAGFSVVDLGADTPVRSFVDAARAADRLIGVGINATSRGNEANVAAAVAAVHAEIGCPVVLGGQAIPEEAAGRALGADRVSLSTQDLIDAFTALAGSEGRRTG
jgi:excisionase family DNA binding protein